MKMKKKIFPALAIIGILLLPAAQAEAFTEITQTDFTETTIKEEVSVKEDVANRDISPAEEHSSCELTSETLASEETTAFEEITPHLLCDVDGDGKVTVNDARYVLRASINLNDINDEYIIFAETDNDGKITVSDARISLRTAIRLSSPETVRRVLINSFSPLCDEPGLAEYSENGITAVVSVPERGHRFESVKEVLPSCTTDGRTIYACKICGELKTQIIKAKGHISSGTKSCTQPEKCTVCNAVLSPAAGHKPTAAATCTKPQKCSACGIVLTPAKGHSYIPATCVKPSVCKFCGATKGTANGHKMKAATYEKPATCSVCGYTKGYPLGVSYTSKGYKVTTNKNGLTYVDGILIVNKTYSLPSSYNPGGLTKECSSAFAKMKAAAKKQGISLWVQSGFRTYSTQKGLYTRYCNADGKAAADRYSARPGHSEHQTGLGIDVNSVYQSFAGTKEGKWLAAHCMEYGFILRYPKGKESFTGYMYEPWHIRYIGSVEKAKKITKSGLSLEEYYGLTSKYKS